MTDNDPEWIEAGADALTHHVVPFPLEGADTIEMSGMYSWDELVAMATVVLAAAAPLIRVAERERLNGIIEEADSLAEYWQEQWQRAVQSLAEKATTRGGQPREITSSTDSLAVFPPAHTAEFWQRRAELDALRESVKAEVFAELTAHPAYTVARGRILSNLRAEVEGLPQEAGWTAYGTLDDTDLVRRDAVLALLRDADGDGGSA